MPGDNLNSETKLDILSEQLTESLRSCRSVVANYRSLLSDQLGLAVPNEDGVKEGDVPIDPADQP